MIQSRLGVFCLSLAVAGAACTGQNETPTFGSVTTVGTGDQWISSTSCTEQGHALVNEAIMASQNIEFGRAWGLSQAALMIDPTCTAAKITQAAIASDFGSEFPDLGSQVSRLDNLSGAPMTDAEAAWMDILQSEEWMTTCAEVAADFPQEGLFHWCAITPDLEGIEALKTFAMEFSGLAAPAYNMLAYGYGQAMWGLEDEDEATSREYLALYSEVYSGPNAFDSRAELLAQFGDIENALEAQLGAIDRGGNTTYGRNARIYFRKNDEEDMRQAVVDAIDELMEAIASEEEQREVINASVSEEVSMCLSNMTPCSHMSRDDYADLVSGIDWIEGSARDIDVTFNDDMSGAIALHIQEGAYMTDEGRVRYSTRVSSVWNLTSGTPRMVHANYAPMGGSGIPASQ